MTRTKINKHINHVFTNEDDLNDSISTNISTDLELHDSKSTSKSTSTKTDMENSNSVSPNASQNSHTIQFKISKISNQCHISKPPSPFKSETKCIYINLTLYLDDQHGYYATIDEMKSAVQKNEHLIIAEYVWNEDKHLYQFSKLVSEPINY